MKLKKRKYKRAPTLVLLNVEIPGVPQKSGRAAVTNISMGGAAFESSIEFSEEDDIDLRFTLPGEKIYLLEGVIKRVHNRGGNFECGVEFKKLSFFDRIKLLKLISIIS